MFVTHKCCSECGENLAIEDFYIEKRRSSNKQNKKIHYAGLDIDQRPMSRCKRCVDKLHRWGAYRQGAKVRGYSFLLSRDLFFDLLGRDCYYCGQPAAQTRLGVNGLDRVNNDLGYDAGNVVPCCAICNSAKHSLTQEQFFLWIDRLIANNSNRVVG